MCGLLETERISSAYKKNLSSTCPILTPLIFLFPRNAIAKVSKNKANISGDNGEPYSVPQLRLNGDDITPLVRTVAIVSV